MVVPKAVRSAAVEVASIATTAVDAHPCAVVPPVLVRDLEREADPAVKAAPHSATGTVRPWAAADRREGHRPLVGPCARALRRTRAAPPTPTNATIPWPITTPQSASPSAAFAAEWGRRCG